jgi:hypothetical protein
MGEEKTKITELLKREAENYRRDAEVCERIGDNSYGLLRLQATVIEKMVQKINKEI